MRGIIKKEKHFVSIAQVAKFIITTLNVGVFGFLIMFQPTFPLISQEWRVN